MTDLNPRNAGSLATAGSLADTADTSVPDLAVIDANMHWLPENLFSDEQLLAAFVDSVPRAYGIEAKLVSVPGKNLHQIVIEQPRGQEVLNYVENQYSAAGQIADMDSAKIDQAILRLPCWQEWLDLDSCRKVNDGLAQHVKNHPGRFHALAVAPPWGERGALHEVERCIKELGFRGVQMAAHYGDLYLDDEAFTPYFSFLEKLGVPVVVHHTPMPVEYHSIVQYPNLRRQFGRCLAQATAVGRELFGGLFDRHPNLQLIHSMLGGGFFAFADMLVPPATGKDAVDRFEDQTARIRSQLARNIYFDLSGAPQWGAAQLECAVKVFGADHILYGSSYPIRRDWFSEGVGFVRDLAISDADKAWILGGNARRLFKLG